MKFADILPHLLAGHEAMLGNDPQIACRYRIRHGKVQTLYPHWPVWITRDSISITAIRDTTWNYAPADSPPTTPPSE